MRDPGSRDGAARPSSKSREGAARRLFSARIYPLRYLVIPKCGCTFVKNVIWRLDHGICHPNPKRIHDDDDKILRASDLGMGVDDVVAEGLAFTILRNPIDRFFSLYKDKIIGSGHYLFPPLRSVLADKYGLDLKASNESDHRRNCHILIDWLENNIATGVDLKPDPHWTAQSVREKTIGELQLRILTLENVSNQMQYLLGSIIPELKAAMNSTETNRSNPTLSRRAILDRDVSKRVNQVYSKDRRWYRNAVELWRQVDMGVASDVPRFSSDW
jgi:Sulfotransferase family